MKETQKNDYMQKLKIEENSEEDVDSEESDELDGVIEPLELDEEEEDEDW